MVRAITNTCPDIAALEAAFRALSLDPSAVCETTEEDTWRYRQVLSSLLSWVRAYRETPDRERLRQRGFEFPPVEPGTGPDEDWILFERWVTGQPGDWSYVEEYGELPAVDQLSPEEIRETLVAVSRKLATHGVALQLINGIPDRLAYAYLRKEIVESRFAFMGEGSTLMLTGCTGYCPGCFQRPWCEHGCSEMWLEDDEAGHMVCPAEVE